MSVNNRDAADAGTGAEADRRIQQELTELKREYERLRDEKVRADRDVETLTRQLEELKLQAEAEYGTSDPERLLALLEQKREENARLVADYREHLRAIRADLEAVENAERNAGDEGTF
jgi:chromosome segregation ATPase